VGLVAAEIFACSYKLEGEPAYPWGRRYSIPGEQLPRTLALAGRAGGQK